MKGFHNENKPYLILHCDMSKDDIKIDNMGGEKNSRRVGNKLFRPTPLITLPKHASPYQG